MVHVTEARELLPSILTGLDQLVPFQLSAFPPLSTAMQKLELSHERPAMMNAVGSIFEP